MRVARMQQAFVPFRFVAKQQQALRIRVKPANRINIFRKTKFRQRTVWRAVASELRQDAERFVKGDEHDAARFSHRAAATGRKFLFVLASRPPGG